MPGQITTLKEIVDQAKGSALTVSGMALAAVASDMETAGKKGRFEEITALYPELQRQFQILEVYLRAIRQTPETD